MESSAGRYLAGEPTSSCDLFDEMCVQEMELLDLQQSKGSKS
jgi:hypothetical protein